MGCLTISPSELSCFKFSILGSNSLSIGGFDRPTHKPQSMMFSAFILIEDGRFRSIKYTGHTLMFVDLNIAISSEDREKARLQLVELGKTHHSSLNLALLKHPKYHL